MTESSREPGKIEVDLTSSKWDFPHWRADIVRNTDLRRYRLDLTWNQCHTLRTFNL